MARALCVDLGGESSPADLVRRAHALPGLIALIGSWAGGTPVLTSHPLEATSEVAALDDQPAVSEAPAGFVGGGWFGRLPFDGVPFDGVPFDGEPCLARYDHVVRLVDGRWRFEALWTAAAAERLARQLDLWRRLLAAPTPRPEWSAGDVDGPLPEEHLAAVEAAVELVRAGELYQVNVCTRLAGRFAGSPAALFAAAVEELAPAYAAYVAGVGGAATVSLSPELFLRRRGRVAESSPIKGTLPRRPGNDRALRRSVKDVAENVMIVDLVRNDLGRVSETGSVRPTSLLAVLPAPGVWHLASTVAGRLRAGVSDADLLAATFPPGSVTGAPKLRALEAIRVLEPRPRGTFTGAIGFAGPSWGAEFSVAIRTFEIAGGRLELGVGGGVTADSVPALEWQECLHKAAPLLRVAGARPAAHLVPGPERAGVERRALLETILAVDGRPWRLGDHLARLDRSSRELWGAGVPGDLVARVREAAAREPSGRAVVRVVLDQGGTAAVTAATTAAVTASVTARPAPVPAGPTALSCAPRPAGCWRHKWADRSWAAADTLFVGADGTVLETERGNVFLIEPDGTLVTPPLREDLLPGVTRRALLDLARDTGRPTVLRPFGVPEMTARPAFWTSSLNGAVPIATVDGVALPRADHLVRELRAGLLGGDPAIR